MGVVVCITGMSGTGKDTTAKSFISLTEGKDPEFWKDMPNSIKEDFQKLNCRVTHVNPSFRDYISEYGYPDVKEFAADVAKAAETGEPEKLVGFDEFFDNELIRIVAEAREKYDVVLVTTRLGPWIIKDADIKIALIKSPELRAEDSWPRRSFERQDLLKFKTKEELAEYFTIRDEADVHRYKKVYGIDIRDIEGFFKMEAHKNLPDHRAAILLKELKEKGLIDI